MKFPLVFDNGLYPLRELIIVCSVITSSADNSQRGKQGHKPLYKQLGMVVVVGVVVVGQELPMVLVDHLAQLVLQVLLVLVVRVVLLVLVLRVVQLVQLELLVVLVVRLVLGLLVVQLVLGVRRVRRVLGHRVVLGLLVGLVVVVEVVGLLVRNTRVDKREHRMRDKEQRKPLAISCLKRNKKKFSQVEVRVRSFFPHRRCCEDKQKNKGRIRVTRDCDGQ